MAWIAPLTNNVKHSASYRVYGHTLGPSQFRCIGIVRESGSIVKCFDEMCGEFLVSDELRKVL